MQALEIIVVVVGIVLVLTWAVRALRPRLRLSEPLVLLCGGCVVGLTPPFAHFRLDHDLVLLLFLPALLYWESLTTSLREIASNLRVIVLQSTVLVVATTVAVAAVAHGLGFSWSMAFVLGAVLGPTDVAAVSAVARDMPRRELTVLRTEALVNDGTALVLLSVALAVAVGREPFSWSGAVTDFVLSYGGGVAIGLAWGVLLGRLRRGLGEDTALHSTISVVTPFAVFLSAHGADVSGVLAVVSCGLLLSRSGPRVIGSAARLQGFAFWRVTTFQLNASLFVLVGMDLPGAVRALTGGAVLRALATAVAVAGAVIAVRFVWAFTTPYVIRALDRRAVQRARRMGARRRLPLAWAGMRGAISLAAALTVPGVAADGRPVAERSSVVFITVVVILVTLTVLGPALPAVVRFARYPPDVGAVEEERFAMRRLSAEALAALPALAERLEVPAEESERVAADLRRHTRPTDPEMSATVRDDTARCRLELALADVKRDVLVRLRDDRLIDDIVLRRVQELLDVEVLRLSLRASRLATLRDTAAGGGPGPPATGGGPGGPGDGPGGPAGDGPAGAGGTGGPLPGPP